MNENSIAFGILVTAFGLAYIGLDDGSLVKMICTAYLGWLIGKRRKPNS